MKYFYSLLILIITFGALPAQSDFNEPPTRSEFEQVKSKIQVYERNQNNVLARMNGINAEIDNAFVRLDSVMYDQEMYLDSVIQRMALESQGIQEEAVAKFLTTEDLVPINDEIDKKLKAQNEENMLLIYGLAGGIGLVLILLILFFILSGKKVKKLRKELLTMQEENKTAMENSIAEMENSLAKLESMHKADNDQLKKEIDKQTSAIRTSTDLSVKSLQEKSSENMKTISKNLEAGIEEVNAAWKKAIDSMKKSSDEKLSKSDTSFNEKLSDIETSFKSEIDKLSDIKDKLVADVKKLEKQK
jgi:rubrerythrin